MYLSRFRAASAALAGTGFAAALVLGAAAVPAQAAGPAHPDLYVKIIGRQMSAGIVDKYFTVEVGNHGTIPATKTKVTFDTSKGDSRYTYTGIGADGTRCEGAVCTFDALAPGQVVSFSLYIERTGRELTTVGSAGSITASVTSAEPDAKPGDNTTTADFSVVPAGIDLTPYTAVWTGQRGDNHVKAGDRWPLVVGIGSAGDVTQHPEAVTITIEVPHSVGFVERYQDCTYETDWYGTPKPAGTVYGPSTVTCTVPWLPLGHGMVLHGKRGEKSIDLFTLAFGSNLDGPAYKDIKISARTATLPVLPACALAAQPTCETLAREVADEAGLKLPTGPGSAKPAPEIEPADNDVAYQIATGANPADLVVTAGKATGKVGDTVDMRIDVKNRGPADAPSWRAELTAPTGTKFVGTTDAWCGKASPAKPASKLVCDHPALLPVSAGPYTAGISFTAKVKILSANVGGDGLVTVSQPGTEKNAADNKARIQIEVPGAGNGNGGGAGGGPAGGAAGGPAGGAAGGPAGGGGAAPASGGLPVTGSQVALIATAGGIALLIGAVLFVLTKRRRVALVTPDE
jgi:LPXTG-motif cell wall-anchored protein